MRIGRVHMTKDLSEPLGTQERRQQINEQEQCHDRSQQKHAVPLYTLSQPIMKAHMSPRPASPMSNMAGIQRTRSIYRSIVDGTRSAVRLTRRLPVVNDP